MKVITVNSELDVQRRWSCALVTSRSDVRHYVDMRDSCNIMLKEITI